MTHDYMRVVSTAIEEGVLNIQWRRSDNTGINLIIHPDGDCNLTIRTDPKVYWGMSRNVSFKLKDGYPEELVKEIGADES